MPAQHPTATPPANRAERRAAARGRSARQAGRPAAPRRTDARGQAPARSRTDFVARRGG